MSRYRHRELQEEETTMILFAVVMSVNGRFLSLFVYPHVYLTSLGSWLSSIILEGRSPRSLVQIPPLPALYQRAATKRLASGAEAGATVLHRDPLDGAAANGAGFASPMSNLKVRMSCAQLALGADVGIHAGAFAADGCLKNPADAMI